MRKTDEGAPAGKEVGTDRNGELDRYVKLVPFLGETMGECFKVILYDMAAPACPALASANSTEEDREKLRSLLPQAAASQKARSRGYLANYPFSVEFGKILRVSMYFISGADGGLLGALCVCMRCELFFQMDSFVKGMLQFNMDDMDLETPEENQADVSREVSLDTIAEVVREFGVEPGRATQRERMEILFKLYGMGVYNLKGAVARTADELQISEQSVYRYLSKVKKSR